VALIYTILGIMTIAGSNEFQDAAS